MSKLSCLIVDDEPIAREIIQNYCNYLPALDVVGLCGNAFEAKAILQEKKVDLFFLDINMPVLDGISFFKTLKPQSQVIFTTAYKEFASDAFDLAACDYLLKPFSLDRFIIAVDKALERIQTKPITSNEKFNSNTENYFFIKSDGKIHKVLYDHLLFAEAMGNYTRVVTEQLTLLPTITFSGFEELLPKALFLRVHRSFIINKSKITHIEGNRVFINTHQISIGSNYKEAFLNQLGL